MAAMTQPIASAMNYWMASGSPICSGCMGEYAACGGLMLCLMGMLQRSTLPLGVNKFVMDMLRMMGCIHQRHCMRDHALPNTSRQTAEQRIGPMAEVNADNGV